jgi:uncharacterized protein YutE (UPF0331/DUF86 family)
VVEERTVRALLGTIEYRLRRLQRYVGIGLAEFEADQDLQDIVERNLEVLIQATIDLGLHLLAGRADPLPETNRAVFTRLVQEGIVEAELGGRLERMAGFRNLLAHGYSRLVPEQVHASLSHLDDVRSYVRSVARVVPSASG